MLLIYVPKITNRLGYTVNVVMRDLLHTAFSITTDKETFARHGGARLCYGPERVGDATVPYLKSCRLLFETTIEEQDCRHFSYQGQPALFPVFGNDVALPFDPLAAIFYMLSRYEEYLPHRTDEHGRFVAAESLAYRHGFLRKAVVDRWALMVKGIILQHYPDTVFHPRHYRVVATVDIDSAYCYRSKGLFRTVMGLLRDGLHRHDTDEVRHRLRVLRGKEHDPYDTFDYIIDQSRRHGSLVLLFFPLLGDYGIYDKPISYHNTRFRDLLQHIADHAKMGIHTSYYCSDDPRKIEIETGRLSDIIHRPIVRNRFHFLRFRLPHDYRNLERNGIRHDYTMGYAEEPGFRCGTSSQVPFYDLSSDHETQLLLHPFVVMDTTLQKYLHASPDEAVGLMHALIDEVREVGSTFSCIFHNQNLCERFGWEGWRRVYEDTLDYACRPQPHRRGRQHTQYTQH